jgi:hypothetical protein
VPRKVAFPLDNADDRPQNTCGFKSITTRCRAARPKGSIKEEGLMARTFVALGLFLATSIGFAGPAPAQYNVQYNPQYNNPQYNSPGTYQGYQGNQGYQGGQQGGYQGNQGYPGGQQGGYQGNQGYPGGQQGGYQGNQGYPGGQQGGYQGNQTGCPYGQQFDPRQNRCVTAAAAMPSCPAGQQFDQSQNRCVYTLPGGVTVPGQLLGR